MKRMILLENFKFIRQLTIHSVTMHARCQTRSCARAHYNLLSLIELHLDIYQKRCPFALRQNLDSKLYFINLLHDSKNLPLRLSLPAYSDGLYASPAASQVRGCCAAWLLPRRSPPTTQHRSSLLAFTSTVSPLHSTLYLK